MSRQLIKPNRSFNYSHNLKSWHRVHAVIATLTTIAFVGFNLATRFGSSSYRRDPSPNHPPSTDDSDVCDSSTFAEPAVPLFVKWEHFMPQTRDLFFIQLGANVGENVGSGDPLWEYVRPCHWSGVAVELVSSTFRQLKENYADVNDRVTTLNHGVSDKRGYAGMKGLGGETARILEIVAEIPPGDAAEEYVEIVTIHDVWEKVRHRIPSAGVDILVLDVEGNEANILARGDGELPAPKPKRILFEIAHLDRQAKDEIDDKLRAQGYRQSADLIHRDEFAIRNNMPAQDRLYELIE